MDLFSNKSEKLIKVSDVQISDAIKHRVQTFLPPIDDALGGGFVRGSVILFGGEPGVGKTTLLLQLLGIMSQKDVRCVYDSAEEATEQLKGVCQRVKAEGDFFLGNIAEVGELVAAVQDYKADLLVVDSIQGFHVKEVDSRTGSPTQLKESCNHLIKFAKDSRIALAIICQLAKDGSFRGPKDLEHNVDVVGNLTHGKNPDKYRILMFSKNRFGPTMRAKHIPWLCNEGRYNFDPTAIIETVEKVPTAIKPIATHVNMRVEEHSARVAETNVDHLKLAAYEFSKFPKHTPNILVSIFNDIGSVYGPFRVTEEDAPIFGIGQEQFRRVLAMMGQDPMFKVESESPWSICVV